MSDTPRQEFAHPLGAPSEPVSITGFFSSLARDVGARSASPKKDGAILFTFRDAVVLPDGSELFQLNDRERRAALKWTPRIERGTRMATGLTGGVNSRGLTSEQVDLLASRIAKSSRRREIKGIAPLAWRPTGARPVELSVKLLEGPLGMFLREDDVQIEGFRLHRLQAVAGGVRLPFSDDRSRLVLELRSSPPPNDPNVWAPVAPLLVAVVEDAGTTSFGKAKRLVETYVHYAIRRAIDPRAPVHSSRARLHIAESLSRLPEESSQRPFFDRRDEVAEDAFFINVTDRGVGALEATTTILEADDSVAFVSYAHPTCFGKLPFLDSVEHSRWMWHRFSPIPLTIPEKPLNAAYLPEMDLMQGSEERLRLAVKEAVSREATRIIAVVNTCISELIGMDVESIVREECEGHEVVPIFFKAATDDGTSMSSIWARIFDISRPATKQHPDTINLVGFCAEDSRIANELRLDLERLGVSVNGFVIPSVRSSAIERFFESGTTLVNRSRMCDLEFWEARQRFPGMNPIDIDPPFGRQGTQRFLETVTRECEVASNVRPEELWEPHAYLWKQWQRRAKEHAAGIIIGPDDTRYLLHPPDLYGLPVMQLLEEMGFGVRVICRAKPSDAEQFAEKLSKDLKSRFSLSGAVTIESSSSEMEISRAIRDLDVSLVFTEYPPDRRALLAGCSSFHPRDFEMGYSGAVRTLMRLVRKAESDFPSTFQVSCGEL